MAAGETAPGAYAYQNPPPTTVHKLHWWSGACKFNQLGAESPALKPKRKK